MPRNCNTHTGRLKGQNTTKTYIHTHRNPPKRKTRPTRTDERHSTSIILHKSTHGVTGMLMSTQSVKTSQYHKSREVAKYPHNTMSSTLKSFLTAQTPESYAATVGDPGSSLHRTCMRCTTTTAGGHESPAYWVDATIPWPPCSAPTIEHDEPAPQSAPHPTETATDQKPPARTSG